MGAMQPWHIILVVVVFLVLFGSKKLPDAARGLGRSMRIFKSEVSEMHKDEAGAASQDTAGTRELSPGRATSSDRAVDDVGSAPRSRTSPGTNSRD
ncbi:Sec-independent protein translocase subunit TatA [Williamsia sp.]|uniref:Sec-independent protein translocase subunit TatA n=1 Tax=Williamsia sp. TaxID=1872085 RepID=UPI002F94BF39